MHYLNKRDKSLDKIKEEEVEAPPKKRKHDLKSANGDDQNDDQKMEVTENGGDEAEAVTAESEIKTKKSKKKKNKDKEKEKEVEND